MLTENGVRTTGTTRPEPSPEPNAFVNTRLAVKTPGAGAERLNARYKLEAGSAVVVAVVVDVDDDDEDCC